ncbi:ly6/PLAUR domain-containing protein 6 isoform X2 [Oryctolagus cuniculus]|uniref:ly6/PLAUR domain-containing protein 6 isoform X2 n=1 Tax=Oryctolagus cuniculus TaxID=9986 RepID=UPI00222F5526|nr:ly6/PLAUR domain-containing protein 6 isoform X4 [Oryctolagus cuniculus]
MTPWSAMEPGPALAWLLLLSLLADCLKAAQSRDFTVKDIIYLHPSTTPYPGGFKCFTCEKAADNYECNRWAPDIYCPRGIQLLEPSPLPPRVCIGWSQESERLDIATLSIQWKSRGTASLSQSAVSHWKSACPLAAETPSMKATRSALPVVKEISVTCQSPEMKPMPHLPPRHL